LMAALLMTALRLGTSLPASEDADTLFRHAHPLY